MSGAEGAGRRVAQPAKASVVTFQGTRYFRLPHGQFIDREGARVADLDLLFALAAAERASGPQGAASLPGHRAAPARSAPRRASLRARLWLAACVAWLLLWLLLPFGALGLLAVLLLRLVR